MTPFPVKAALAEAARLGVTLTPEGSRIRATPPQAVTPALARLLRTHKARIMAALEVLDLVAAAFPCSEIVAVVPAEAFEERSAIMEYCGGLTRPEAERLARLDVAQLTDDHARATIGAYEHNQRAAKGGSGERSDALPNLQGNGSHTAEHRPIHGRRPIAAPRQSGPPRAVSGAGTPTTKATVK